MARSDCDEAVRVGSEIRVNATAIVADVSEIVVLERKGKHAKRSCSSLTTISRKSCSRNNFVKAKDNTCTCMDVHVHMVATIERMLHRNKLNTENATFDKEGEVKSH